MLVVLFFIFENVFLIISVKRFLILNLVVRFGLKWFRRFLMLRRDFRIFFLFFIIIDEIVFLGFCVIVVVLIRFIILLIYYLLKEYIRFSFSIVWGIFIVIEVFFFV